MNDQAPASEPPEYVIGAFDGGLVVVDLDEARRLAALNEALAQPSTWGDFLWSTADDEATLSYLTSHYDGGLPETDDIFDANEVPGFTEGTRPPFPKTRFGELPESVMRLGSMRATAVDGDLLHISEERRDDVVAALDGLGSGCVEDKDLIERACGSWRYA